MRRNIATVILISFILIAVFGFLGMFGESDLGYHGCLADTAQGATCPVNAGALGMINFHLGTFLSFSSAILAYVLILLLVVLFLGTVDFSFDKFSGAKVRSAQQQRSGNFYASRRSQLGWLALHSNSPSDF
ncbi:MAG: hypothetical protein PHW95_03335 [Patescibacteria group bacterium]|nr:hypothetical protein [Patescibacteria group bacterium]